MTNKQGNFIFSKAVIALQAFLNVRLFRTTPSLIYCVFKGAVCGCCALKGQCTVLKGQCAVVVY